MWNKLERKFGKLAIPHLINYLIGGYAIGYLLTFGSMYTNLNFLSFMTLEPYYIIHHFQFWRIITWVMIPPQDNIIFALIMMLFYWQLGTVLEQSWGTFKFNCYIFGGILFTLIGAFVLYALTGAVGIGNYFSTYYINMSIFLAFAMSYPDMEVLLYFIIPIKMKWMALVYAVLILFEIVSYGWAGRTAIICSLLNFLIFYLLMKKEGHPSRASRARQAAFHKDYDTKKTVDGKCVARHKCAICGRTDVTHPDLEFRYCSKCNGNYEYCQDHLFTHTHVL